MSRTSAAIEERIREHVVTLAATIGERNVFHPEALAAARDYIEAVFAEQGYRVSHQTYEAGGVLCANLEATRSGGAKRDRYFSSARITTASPAVRAPTITEAAWRRCWRSPLCSPTRPPS